jgi:hypothetical protein
MTVRVYEVWASVQVEIDDDELDPALRGVAPNREGSAAERLVFLAVHRAHRDHLREPGALDSLDLIDYVRPVDGPTLPPVFERTLPRVEILHERDPDSSCDVSLYLDGRLITYKDTSYVEESVDPGAGGSLSDWNEHIAVLEADEGLSEAFRTAAVEANNRGAESPYLDDDEDDEFTLADEPEEPEDIDDGLFDELVTDDLPEG